MTKKTKKQNTVLKIPMNYIVVNKKNIFKSFQSFLQLSVSYIKFDIDCNSNEDDLFNCYAKTIQTKDVQLLSYCEKNSLFCLTINDRCFNKLFSSAHGEDILSNSIWFCVDVTDIYQYKDMYQSVITLFRGVFPVAPLSDIIYTKFKKSVYKKKHSSEKEFILDWSSYLSATLNFSIKSPKKSAKQKTTVAGNQCFNGSTLEITDDDLLCLKPDNCLNDKIINFYMMYIYNEVLNDDDKDRSHFFNLFFNTKLIGTDSEQETDTPESRHARVCKWTKNVDLFSKDFVFIPVIEDTHWFLVVVCFPWMAGMVDYSTDGNFSSIPKNESVFATEVRVQKVESIKSKTGTSPQPCILIFDSFTTKSRIEKVRIIREYLNFEWDSKRGATDGPLIFDKTTCRGYSPKVPQQKNLFDCGIFLLLYVECFFKVPIVDFSLSFFKIELIEWFTKSDVKKKRTQIKEVIKRKLNQ